MPSEEEKKRKRDELKGRLLSAFNKVSDDKVVKINEFVASFAREDDKHFITASRWNPARIKQALVESMAEEQMRKLAARKPPAQEGIYTALENGKPQTYVTAAWMKRRVIGAIESGRADDRMTEVEQAGYATVDAIATSPDHSAGVKSGQLKPTKPPKAGS
jgi:hypothetical protein